MSPFIDPTNYPTSNQIPNAHSLVRPNFGRPPLIGPRETRRPFITPTNNTQPISPFSSNKHPTSLIPFQNRTFKVGAARRRLDKVHSDTLASPTLLDKHYRLHLILGALGRAKLFSENGALPRFSLFIHCCGIRSNRHRYNSNTI